MSNRFLPSGQSTRQFRREQERRCGRSILAPYPSVAGNRSGDRPVHPPSLDEPSPANEGRSFSSPNQPAGRAHHPAGGLKSWLWVALYLALSLAVIAIAVFAVPGPWRFLP